MANVNIIVNDKKEQVPAGLTILQAAAHLGIEIPTLCKLKDLDPTANCRICVVEVERARTLLPACSTRVGEGMVIHTDSEKVRKSRKLTLELLLARHAVDCHHCLRIGSSKCDDLDPVFCEMCFFCDCVKEGFCDLQALAREYKVDQLPFEIEGITQEIDASTDTVIRNPNKCVKCRRCVDVCNEVQTVHNLTIVNRGTEAKVEPELGKCMAESSCVQCGKCIDVCPTGAIYAKEHKDELLYHTHSYETTTVAQISRDILPELAKLSKIEEKEIKIESVIAGLYKIGVDYVLVDDYAVGKVQKEAEEKINQKIGKVEPIILTNSLAATKFIENNFAELKKNVVNYSSEQEAFGTYVRTEFAKEKGLKVENIKTIAINNNNENTTEAKEKHSVDICVNARELYRIFLRTGVNLKLINGKSAVEMKKQTSEVPYKELLEKVDWTVKKEPKVATIKMQKKNVEVAIAKNLGQTRNLLDEVKNNESPYSIIRVNA